MTYQPDPTRPRDRPSTQPNPHWDSTGAAAWPDLPPPPMSPPPPPAGPPIGYQAAAPLGHVFAGQGSGPIGRVRPTGICLLLTVVTLGIYPLVWFYQVHEEMKRHTGQGLGGAVALILGFFISFVMSFLSPAEVGALYERRGQRPPVTALTGLWATLGALILIGPIVWFVKTNGALNAYWRSVGAQG